MAVTLDENYSLNLPLLNILNLFTPTDIQFASDGSTYILEYGTNWFKIQMPTNQLNMPKKPQTYS